MISKGEKKIIDLLKANKVNFKREVTFQHLVGKKSVPLRYDFGVCDARGNIVLLIEYDGEQHFSQNPRFHKSLRDFKACMERDRKKNNFALTRRLPLYRIPYWELEDLTFDNLFSPTHLVTTQYHNDNLRRMRNESK